MPIRLQSLNTILLMVQSLAVASGQLTFGLLGTAAPAGVKDGKPCSMPPCSAAVAHHSTHSRRRLLNSSVALPPPHAHLESYSSHRRILTRPLLHLGLSQEPPEDAGYPLMYITSAFLGEPGAGCTLRYLPVHSSVIKMLL